MKDSEFYTSARILGTSGYANLANHRYVLDTRQREMVTGGVQGLNAAVNALNTRMPAESQQKIGETLDSVDVVGGAESSTREQPVR